MEQSNSITKPILLFGIKTSYAITLITIMIVLIMFNGLFNSTIENIIYWMNLLMWLFLIWNDKKSQENIKNTAGINNN